MLFEKNFHKKKKKKKMLFEKREKHKTLLKNPLSELFKSKLSTEKIIQTKHKTKTPNLNTPNHSNKNIKHKIK